MARKPPPIARNRSAPRAPKARPVNRSSSTTNTPKGLTPGQAATRRRTDFTGSYSNPGGVPKITPGTNYRTTPTRNKGKNRAT